MRSKPKVRSSRGEISAASCGRSGTMVKLMISVPGGLSPGGFCGGTAGCDGKPRGARKGRGSASSSQSFLADLRSEARRVGTECVRKGSTRGSQYHLKKNTKQK